MPATRSAAGWSVAAVLATGSWLVAGDPLDAVAEFLAGLTVPVASVRIGLAVPRSKRTTIMLVAALAASAVAIAGTLLLRSSSSPFPGMLGALIGYLWATRGLDVREGGTDGDLRATKVRRLVVAVVWGAFAGYCAWREGQVLQGDIAAEWFIRAVLSGIIAAYSLAGALFRE